MRSIKIDELKNHLRKYLRLAKTGEEIIIQDGKSPIAKLVPYESQKISDEELLLVATGQMRLPRKSLDVDELFKIPTGRVAGNAAIQAVLDERDEGM